MHCQRTQKSVPASDSGESPFHEYSDNVTHILRKRWNGRYFEKVSLKLLGLRIQLGHPRGEACLNPTQCPGDSFIVIHSNGLHEVGLDFCGCGKDNQLHTVQLLRSRLFPATIVNPKTAVTMEALDLFSVLSYESKMSAFQFYYSLVRLTDNTGLYKPKVWCHYLVLIPHWLTPVSPRIDILLFFAWFTSGDIL